MTLEDTKLTDAGRRELDLLSLDQLERLYGPGTVETEFWPGRLPDGRSKARYWRQGDERPAVTFEDDVAAAQAAGRCSASRVRGDVEAVGFHTAIHPAPCRFCEVPKLELLAALDHAAFHSRYIASEYVRWPTKGGSYSRPTGRADTYENPRWAAFFAQPRELRARAILEARACYPSS